MALTNKEKSYLRSEVKDYIRRGISKREARYALIREGFKASTIDKYWFIFSSVYGAWTSQTKRGEMIEMDFEKFFKEEWERRYKEKIPCEEIEEGCEDNEEGTLVDGFSFADRLLVWIQNDSEIAFFRQEKNNERYPSFKIGKDIFMGPSFELIPKLAETWLYPDSVVIFSEGKELFSSSYVNIGEAIDKVMKEQERLLTLSANKQPAKED